MMMVMVVLVVMMMMVMKITTTMIIVIIIVIVVMMVQVLEATAVNIFRFGTDAGAGNVVKLYEQPPACVCAYSHVPFSKPLSQA